ncbi:hypothetical protein [Aquimarina longa]|uniref:hypothetical protein n=1 Tax=Aquimarina longa TaxID=1080221 RepID=UPI000782F4F0|nr:hypothetical protein [Aquimarina longa]
MEITISVFFKDGKESKVTDAILSNYTESRTSIKTSKIEADSKNDYFKFLSDTKVEVSEEGDVFKVEYVFKDGFLFLTYDNQKYLYGQGDKTE